jgi:hypothetical protein
MQVTPPSRSSEDWVMLPDHTMIARRTLRLVRALLKEAHGNPNPVPPERSTWPLVDIPELDAVGGVVQLKGAKGEPIVVARVGRSSYAAFRLGADPQEVEQVLMEYDEETRRLRLG